MTPDPDRASGATPWGTVRVPIVLRFLTGSLVIAAALRFAFWLIRLAQDNPESLGVDYRLHMEAAQRWMDGGSFYQPWQLAAPYPTIGAGEILYPPIALALFVPFTFLPWVLWWAVPASSPELPCGGSGRVWSPCRSWPCCSSTRARRR